jgi:hypothetical protein
MRRWHVGPWVESFDAAGQVRVEAEPVLDRRGVAGFALVCEFVVDLAKRDSYFL